ncbi:neuronal acetylcholine receptor subunit beta-4-like [Anopheles nili]|uniref:neuronal acetylcholine receptor subunit beta-4-like n=1 Tax=Anopheles nili TaxID=185578 RepID=UPI00237C0264|nr:neuronal acetylcholine receptor subunit beta-4-like [Anopheles nili]
MVGLCVGTIRIVRLLGWIALLLNHVLPAASVDCSTDSGNVENRLKNSLLCNGYRVDARPRKDHTQMVNLSVTYHVLTYEFSEDDDLLELGVWMDLRWTDDFLRWNSSEWEGIDRLAINSYEMWLPDFRHFSSYYNPEELQDCVNPKCSVAMNGSVFCLPVCSLNAKCDADYSRWPFDVHKCEMWYGAWANSMDEVDMHLKDVCLGKNTEFTSPKWSIVSLEKRRSVVFSTDSYKYPVLNVELILIRKASFEQVAIIGPILVLALLNVYTVWLRSNSFERKVMLGISISCHFATLKQLEWTLPYNRDTLPDCMIFMLSSTILGVVLLIQTLLSCWIRTQLNLQSTTGSFIDRWTAPCSQSRVAELILSADYLELNHKVIPDENKNSWERLAKLFDRAVAISCVIIYVVLFPFFIPFEHRLDESQGVKCVIAA